MSSNENSVIHELVYTGGGIVTSGVLGYYAIKGWNGFKSTCAGLSKISQAKVVPISGLHSLISSTSSESESSKEVLVIVRGITQVRSCSPPHVLVSQFSGEKCVMLEQNWVSFPFINWIKLFFKKRLEFKTDTSLSKIPFILSGNGKGKDSDHVIVNMEGSTQSLPLSPTFDRFRIKHFNISSRVRYAPFPQLLLQEKILPIEKEISVVGICNSRGGNPQIRACKELPYFLSELTRDEMLQWLTKKRYMLFFGTLLLGSLSLNVFVYHTYPRLLHLWEKWEQRKNDNIHGTSPDTQDDDIDDGDGTSQDIPDEE